MTENEQARPNFWSVNIGQLSTMIIFALGLIWATAVYATKSTSDIDGGKDIATALKARIEVVDAKSAAMDARMVGVETSIVFIRESLARIERAVTEPKK